MVLPAGVTTCLVFKNAAVSFGGTVTYTQPAVTRDSATGNVTNRPPITVS